MMDKQARSSFKISGLDTQMISMAVPASLVLPRSGSAPHKNV